MPITQACAPKRRNAPAPLKTVDAAEPARGRSWRRSSRNQAPAALVWHVQPHPRPWALSSRSMRSSSSVSSAERPVLARGLLEGSAPGRQRSRRDGRRRRRERPPGHCGMVSIRRCGSAPRRSTSTTRAVVREVHRLRSHRQHAVDRGVHALGVELRRRGGRHHEGAMSTSSSRKTGRRCRR